MTVRRHCRVWFCGLALVAGLGTGCRLFKGERGSDGMRDPLFGRDRIPATDLPTGRENARGHADPLLVPPGKDDDRVSSDLPSGERREPFRTGPNTTAAGLARGNSDPILSVRAEEPVDDRRARGGPVYLQDTHASSNAQRTADELKRYGVTVSDPVREGAEFFARGERIENGHRRRFEGAGSTANAALNDLLEQVRLELGR